MPVSAIVKWLIDEFLKRFQQKASEYLATLIWFDPNRYWLSSIPWLVDRSAQWTFSLEEGNKVPLKLVAVGSDIPEGKGQSPLKIRLSILTDRMSHTDQNSLVDFKHISRWIIYYPYPVEWLNEETRPKKTIPMSWLMPFCEAGLEWGRRGGDEEKLPAFLRAHGVDLTKDKKQLAELYHLTKSDRSASPISRLVVQNLDKPIEFWEGKSWDLNKVQNELVGDLRRQTEELLVAPEATITRLQDRGVLNDFLARLEGYFGVRWNSDGVIANPSGFSRDLVRHVALSTTWKLTGHDTAFPFRPELPPQYKTNDCEETIFDWLRIQEVGEAYVRKCRSLEKEGLNLIRNVDTKTNGHVFPHIILKQWHEVRQKLENAAGTSVNNIRSVLKDIHIEDYDEVWDRLMPGELGWHWLSSLKEIEQRIADGESWLMRPDADDLEGCFTHFTDSQNGWWKIDDIFRKVLVLAVDDPDSDLLKALAFPLYNSWIEAAGQHFTKALIKKTDLQSLKKIPFITKAAETVWSLPDGDKRKAIIITDALRYDLAMDVSNYLEKSGFKVHVKPWLADLPSKTEVGMSRLLPCCDLEMKLKNKKIEIIHNGKNFGVKSNRVEFLKEKLGQDLTTLEIKDVSKANLKDSKSKVLAVFSRDIDAEGEAKGLGLFKDIEKEITEIAQKVQLLARCGYQEVHIITDHGFLLSSPDGLVKWESPQGADACERRFAMIPKNIGSDLPAIPSPWDDDHWLVLPPAGTAFKASGQTEYLHGGASLQEIVIPHICAEVQEQAVPVILTMVMEKDVIESGIVKIDLKGESPVDQLPLSFMPTVVLPRSGNLVAERKGKAVSKTKNFELGVGDQLKLTLFLDRGIKQGEDIDIIARDDEELLSTKTLKVIRDV